MRSGFVLLVLTLVGCDDHLYPSIGEGGASSYSPDWDGAQSFMADHCETCHPSLSPPSMPDGIFDDIQSGTNRYVVPFEPLQSEFWLVLNDESDQFPIMPLGASQPLPDDVIAPLREWILDGASFN